MYKIKDKEAKERVAKRRRLHELKRKDKHYNPVKQYHQKPIFKRLKTPEIFSLIEQCDTALAFFEDFMNESEKATHLKIDMSNTKEMTTEVLLYLISLHKINKANKTAPNILIQAPDKQDLRYLMAISGFSKYFRSRSSVKINSEDIFKIQDKTSNKKKKIDDATTCKEAVDFALKYFPGAKFTDEPFMTMYNALAEMMTNTDNHAYSEEGELRNWYLFGARIETGVAFFFFDNGRGIIKTAKRTLVEKALGKLNLRDRSIIRSVLNGEYRSATGKAYRNKGLPEINEFLTRDDVKLPIILTNRVYSMPIPKDDIKYNKTKHNFKGTLFTWILSTQEVEDGKN